jgi:hypothetical protein
MQAFVDNILNSDSFQFEKGMEVEQRKLISKASCEEPCRGGPYAQRLGSLFVFGNRDIICLEQV